MENQKRHKRFYIGDLVQVRNDLHFDNYEDEYYVGSRANQTGELVDISRNKDGSYNFHVDIKGDILLFYEFEIKHVTD